MVLARLHRTDEPDREVDSSTTLKEQAAIVANDTAQLGRLFGTRVRRGVSAAGQRCSRLGKRVLVKSRESVERRPLATVTLAAGLALLTGFLLRGKSK